MSESVTITVTEHAVRTLATALDEGNDAEVVSAARDLLEQIGEPCSICNRVGGKHEVSCRWG